MTVYTPPKWFRVGCCTRMLDFIYVADLSPNRLELWLFQFVIADWLMQGVTNCSAYTPSCLNIVIRHTQCYESNDSSVFYLYYSWTSVKDCPIAQNDSPAWQAVPDTGGRQLRLVQSNLCWWLTVVGDLFYYWITFARVMIIFNLEWCMRLPSPKVRKQFVSMAT